MDEVEDVYVIQMAEILPLEEDEMLTWYEMLTWFELMSCSSLAFPARHYHSKN